MELPERYLEPWRELSREANRRKVRLEVIVVGEDEPYVDEGGTLRGSFALLSQRRFGMAEHVGPGFETFDGVIAAAKRHVATQPLPGPDALRDELTTFGKRLALAGPRDFSGKRPTQMYVDFRDRVLPLAWDNLVDATRLEVLEDFVRRVGQTTDDPERIPVDDWRALAAEARGLVP